MRIVVVGAGAIGCLVGGRLAAAGHEVTLVTRDWLADTIATSGLRLNIGGESLYVPEISAVTTVKEAVFEFGPFDLALFTMKSYDTAAGISDLSVAVQQPLPVLSLQNGVGNEQLLGAAFGPNHVIAGVITTPAEMPVPGVIRASSGAVGLAALDRETPVASIATVFRSADIETRIYDDWRGLKWSKLLLNMVGNATSAILDWPPEQVFRDPQLFDLEWRAWQEALAVIQAQGTQVVSLPGYPLPWAVRAMRWAPRSLLQPLLRRAIAGGRSGKMPSLHIDLARGRVDSEVTVLNGAVVDAGRNLGIPTPVNEALTDTLMRIVVGRIERDAFRGRPDRLLTVVESKQSQRERVRG
ncbi:MAG: ketopantoate reductase family protein [Anaerolineae bacterium]